MKCGKDRPSGRSVLMFVVSIGNDEEGLGRIKHTNLSESVNIAVQNRL